MISRPSSCPWTSKKLAGVKRRYSSAEGTCLGPEYKKPPKCDGNPTSETMTECANDYIRTKQQFDRAYDARHGFGKQ